MRKVYLCLIGIAALFFSSTAMSSDVPVVSGLVLRLDTSDINTTESGYVTSWNDQSGNNNDAVQSSEANQPMLVNAITPSGSSAVKFDGTNDFLTITPNSTFNGGAWTIFAVYAVDAFETGSGTQRIINLGYADVNPDPITTQFNSSTYSVAVGGTATGVRAFSRAITSSGSGGKYANSGIPTGYAADTFYIGAMTNDSASGNVTSYLMNHAGVVKTATTSGANAVGSGNNVAYIGAGTAGLLATTPLAGYMNGWVAEVLVYNRVLTSEEITSVNAYLDNKYLLSIYASIPKPANNGLAYDQDIALKWTPSTEAASQTVYFSSDFNDVNESVPAALKATLGGDANSCGVTDLKMSNKYYWRVNHVADGSAVYGPIWTFDLPAYYRVDDFEDYISTSSGAGSLRTTWKDGWSMEPPGTELGSCIAMVAKATTADMFKETSNDEIRTLAKSMLFAFDNTGNEWTFTFPSESQAIFVPASPYAEINVSLSSLPIGTDWTVQGDWTLYLYFTGTTGNSTVSPLYLLLEDATGHIGAPIVYPDSNDIAEAEWHTWEICPGDLATNGVDLSNLSKLYIGFGDRNNPQIGGAGTVYFDDIRMHREAKLATDLNRDCKVDFADLGEFALDWLMHAGCLN